MIDWRNVDFEKLDAFERKAYRICQYDNIHFDCSERLCSKCFLCPLSLVTGEPVDSKVMQENYQLFLSMEKYS